MCPVDIRLHSDPVADIATPAMSDLMRAIATDVPITTLIARRLLDLPVMPNGVADPIAA